MLPGSPRSRRLRDELLLALKVSRPGFWATHLWFFLLPLSRREMFDSWVFWVGCVYICFPFGTLLYGWNDLGDADSDRENPRKDSLLFGARPDEAQRRRIPWAIAGTQLPFVVLFVAVAGPRMLGWFALVLLANALYNAPGWGWKSRPGLDLLNQAGYLLVFVLSSWLNGVPQLSGPAMLFSALFAMSSHLFGQIMDVDEDRAAGRRTTACVLGIRRAKLLLVALLAIEAVLAWRFFSSPVLPLFLGAGALGFAADALLLWRDRRYPLRLIAAFFVGWNLVLLASMHWAWKTGLLL